MLACDAPGQGIRCLRWRANAGTELQVESQAITQVDMLIYFPLFSVLDTVISEHHKQESKVLKTLAIFSFSFSLNNYKIRKKKKKKSVHYTRC
jgi:hypothetical protein